MEEIKKRVIVALRERAKALPVRMDAATGRKVLLSNPDRSIEDVTGAVYELARAGVVRLDGDAFALNDAQVQAVA